MTDNDVAATEILGPKCSECGWRGGKHRPAAGELMVACSQWVEADEGGGK